MKHGNAVPHAMVIWDHLEPIGSYFSFSTSTDLLSSTLLNLLTLIAFGMPGVTAAAIYLLLSADLNCPKQG